MEIAPPNHYPANLCDLPAELQHAIEVDRKRWWLAFQVRRSKSVAEGEQWLRDIENPDHRQDMTRRLNQLAEKDFSERQGI